MTTTRDYKILEKKHRHLVKNALLLADSRDKTKWADCAAISDDHWIEGVQEPLRGRPQTEPGGPGDSQTET